MGTFGTFITSDDLVLDVMSTYTEAVKKTQSFDEAKKVVFSDYQSSLNDHDEAHLVYFAIADCQWKYGVLDHDILQKIESIMLNEEGLDLFREEGEKALQKRKTVLDQFLAKLKTANPKPAKMPKMKRASIYFKAGDCISIFKEDNRYYAAIVVNVNTEDVENPTYLLLYLDWSGESIPDQHIFESSKPKIVYNTIFKSNQLRSINIINYGYRKVKSHLQVICNLPSKIDSTMSSKSYSSFANIRNVNV